MASGACTRLRFTVARIIDLPSVIRWFTANIGVYHIHHLCGRIPYYRLPLVLRDNPELGIVGRLTLIQSFRCVRLVLWDEGQQ
jgi:acyl-lipid omega-6 desaturase (Delta-12 desaturase)